MGSAVKLYVYDVTHGMARQMAPVLLGRPLDGVWHTGIVAYGYEYFYGGGGISYCLPSGTILGHPTQVVDLGETEIPQDMFHEYLFELSNERFHGGTYHLLDHNCNTFSNEVAQFLTGQSIPDFITNLPTEIMATPFGQMIRPFIDAMMMEVVSNSAVQIGSNSAPSNVDTDLTTTVNLNATSLNSISDATVPSANVETDKGTQSTSTQAESTHSQNISSEQTKSNGPSKGNDDIDLD